jgi:hypothetical protein
MIMRFVEVTRPKDLLYLQLEFINLKVEGISTTPVLKRIAAGPAFIVLRLPPQHVAEQVRPQGGQLQLPSKAFLSSPSKISVRVPDAVPEVRLGLENLLGKLAEWETTSDLVSGQPGTVVEFPDRLLIVPEQHTRLSHAAMLLTENGWTELWHTKLVVPATEQQQAPPRFRAIANAQDNQDRILQTTLSLNDRRNIVTQSAGNLIQSRFFKMTTLGATASLRSTWPANPGITLSKWEHEAVTGRDVYVRRERQGFLFPFGHRASVNIVTRRVINGSVAELFEQEFLNILEESRSFSGFDMPLKRVVIGTPSRLEGHTGSHKAYRVAATITDSASNVIGCQVDMLFVTVEEAANITAMETVTNVEYINLHDTIDLNGQRIALADDSHNRGDATMAVATLKLGVNVRSFGAGAPSFRPFMLEADIRIPAVDQLTAFGGGNQPPAHALAAAPGLLTKIKHTELYRRSGFAAPNDKKQVFAEFAQTPIDISIPAARAGGLAIPTFKGIDGLSKTMGPVSGVSQFATGSSGAAIDPEKLLGEAKLLGTILLKSIVDTATASATDFLADQPEKLLSQVDIDNFFLPRPIMTTIRFAQTLETRFAWKPKLKEGAVGPFAARPETRLVVRGWIRAIVHPPAASGTPDPLTFEVKGQLKTFGLSLAGLVVVNFKQVEFTLSSGKKMDVSTDVANIEFTDKLAFAKAIQKIIPIEGFDGASIDLQSDGVVVGYALALPSASMGVLSLANIAFVSSVSLPFTDGRPAAVRFSLSKRHSPFVVSVAPFGGTGFFSLEIRTDDTLLIEAAIEFGGIVSFNLLGIVKGGVYLLAGVYLAIETTGKLGITAHLRVGGYIDVLGLITVSIEFYLALEYANNELAGVAKLTIGIKVLFFSETFSFEVRKKIAHFGAIPSGVATDTPPVFSRTQWADYCKAFG